MPPAGTNQQRALSVRLDAKRRLRSFALQDKRRSRVIPGFTPAKAGVRQHCAAMECRAFSTAGIDVYRENRLDVSYIGNSFHWRGSWIESPFTGNLHSGRLFLRSRWHWVTYRQPTILHRGKLPPSPRTSPRFSTRIVLGAISPAR